MTRPVKPPRENPVIEADYVVRRPPPRWLRWLRDGLGMARATYGLWGLIVRLLIAASLMAAGCVAGFILAILTLHRP